jgi:hypothetical protein
VEEQECRSHWIVTDELPEKKCAQFYTRHYRSCEAVCQLRGRHFVMKTKDSYAGIHWLLEYCSQAAFCDG